MFRYYRFGQFLLCVRGNQELLNYLPSWNLEDVKDPNVFIPEITLTQEETDPFTSDHSENGWNAETIHDAYKSVYVFDEKALFALHYKHVVKDVTIHLMKPIQSSIRPGLQFGVLTALYEKCVGLHGVTLLCGNEIIILSAPSGTGKTTLSHLLEKYCNATVINGDFAMLSLDAEGVVFEPTPFCGTSGRCLNHRVKVDRIVFLEQAKENNWQSLTVTTALVKLMSNIFLPAWDSKMQKSILENILRFIPYLEINNYAFAPLQEAAEMFFDNISH